MQEEERLRKAAVQAHEAARVVAGQSPREHGRASRETDQPPSDMKDVDDDGDNTSINCSSLIVRPCGEKGRLN